MTKVLVLGGGDSRERAVSLRSSRAVYEAAKEAGFDVDLRDPQGMSDYELVLMCQNYDCVLPILHGKHGEDGTIQKLLEDSGIQFLGSGSEVSALCIDKQATKDVLSSQGIRVPYGKIVDRKNVWEFIEQYPAFVLKPNDGGSTIDTLIVRPGTSVSRNKVTKLLEMYDTMLAEEFIEGIEVTIPVVDGLSHEPILILLPEGELFDYANKYNGRTKELCPIPDEYLHKAIRDKLKEVGLAVHEAVGARHLSRVDAIVRGDEIVVLEINTIPGLTETSLLPVAAQYDGFSMPQYISHFVSLICS